MNIRISPECPIKNKSHDLIELLQKFADKTKEHPDGVYPSLVISTVPGNGIQLIALFEYAMLGDEHSHIVKESRLIRTDHLINDTDVYRLLTDLVVSVMHYDHKDKRKYIPNKIIK